MAPCKLRTYVLMCPALSFKDLEPWRHYVSTMHHTDPQEYILYILDLRDLIGIVLDLQSGVQRFETMWRQ